MKSLKSIALAGTLAVAYMELFSGCQQESKPESISNSGLPMSDPAHSFDVDIWCQKDGHQDFYVQDRTGQVFELVQCRTNTNLYVVWRETDATNGIR